MSIFGRKKEEADMAQTSEIKEISNSQPESKSLEQNNFNNPFAVNDNNSSMQNETMQKQNTENNVFPQGNISEQHSQTPIPEFSVNNQTNIETKQPEIQTPIEKQTINSNNQNISREEISEMVDEVVEKVIDERWKVLVDKVGKVLSWKEKQEAQLNMVKEDIVNLKEAYELLEKKMLTKIGNYDRNILDVNSEIKALEKVFQKITPTLVNNVNELSKIANKFKDEENLQDNKS